MKIDFNTFNKVIKNKKGEEIKLVLNHIENQDCKMYICKAKEDYWNNCDTIEKDKFYVCYFPPTKTVTKSTMNWSKQGYFGMGSIEHSYDYSLNNFEEVKIYNCGKYMRKNQTKYCTVPIEYIEIIDECKN